MLGAKFGWGNGRWEQTAGRLWGWGLSLGAKWGWGMGAESKMLGDPEEDLFDKILSIKGCDYWKILATSSSTILLWTLLKSVFLRPKVCVPLNLVASLAWLWLRRVCPHTLKKRSPWLRNIQNGCIHTWYSVLYLWALCAGIEEIQCRVKEVLEVTVEDHARSHCWRDLERRRGVFWMPFVGICL